VCLRINLSLLSSWISPGTRVLSPSYADPAHYWQLLIFVLPSTFSLSDYDPTVLGTVLSGENAGPAGVPVHVAKGIIGLHTVLQIVQCRQNRNENLQTNSLSPNSHNYSCYRVYL